MSSVSAYKTLFFGINNRKIKLCRGFDEECEMLVFTIIVSVINRLVFFFEIEVCVDDGELVDVVRVKVKECTETIFTDGFLMTGKKILDIFSGVHFFKGASNCRRSRKGECLTDMEFGIDFHEFGNSQSKKLHAKHFI